MHLVCKPNIAATLDDPEPAFQPTHSLREKLDMCSNLVFGNIFLSLTLHVNRTATLVQILWERSRIIENRWVCGE